MKVGNLVKHKRQSSYGVGLILKVYSFHRPLDRAVVLFSEFMVSCKFMTEDLELISESR